MMYPNSEKVSMKTWAEEDRPREKLALKGRNTLSDAELLAILIGSGTRNETALDLARRILAAHDQNLHSLGKATPHDLQKFRGIGEAKAVTITAALELGRRRQTVEPKDRPQIITSRDAYNVVAPLLLDLPHEEFWILLLNRANRVIGRERVSVGGVNGTVVDVRLLFKRAIELLASSVVLCHNHPSGNVKPSSSDLEITKKISIAGEQLEIAVLDHLIVAEKGYYSFADEGKMK